MTDLLVRRDDLRVWRAADTRSPASPGAGEIRLRVERFGLTANNVTYGAFGDDLGYWEFFPAQEGWGRIPVWGFGEVVASGVDGIGAGDRFYGYFPMSSGVTLRAAPDGGGFVERSDARAALPALYNRYLRAAPELGFAREHDDANAVVRPLFMTGWLIADLLEQAGWHDAGTVVLASASSKTAFTTASEITRRAPRPALVGLTSAGNREFTESLGWYDRVLTYEEVAQLPAGDGLVLVDMAGDPALRRAVHDHAGDALRSTLVVGATHWEGASLRADGGPPAEFFFAPARIEQRAAELGGGELQRRVGTAWAAFAPRVGEILDVEHHTGPDEVGRVYEELVDGRTDPGKAHVATLP